MAYEYPFEKLIVWKDSRELVKQVYKLTKIYPESEKFGLVSQMRRCSISVSSNIAEGSSRRTGKDQAHFYQMATSSVVELLNQLILSVNLEFLESQRLAELRPLIEKISNQLFGLRKSCLS